MSDSLERVEAMDELEAKKLTEFKPKKKEAGVEAMDELEAEQLAEFKQKKKETKKLITALKDKATEIKRD